MKGDLILSQVFQALRFTFAKLICNLLLKKTATLQNSAELVEPLKKLVCIEHEKSHMRTLTSWRREILRLESEVPSVCSAGKNQNVAEWIVQTTCYWISFESFGAVCIDFSMSSNNYVLSSYNTFFCYGNYRGNFQSWRLIVSAYVLGDVRLCEWSSGTSLDYWLERPSPK